MILKVEELWNFLTQKGGEEGMSGRVEMKIWNLRDPQDLDYLGFVKHLDT